MMPYDLVHPYTKVLMYFVVLIATMLCVPFSGWFEQQCFVYHFQVGLAVDDIKSIQEKAVLKKEKLQVF